MSQAKSQPGADFNEAKQYSLQANETQFLRYLKQHQEAIFAGYLSTIAGSRLGYRVTPNTKFEITNDFTNLQLTELPPQEQPEAHQGTQQTDVPEASSDSPVKEAK